MALPFETTRKSSSSEGLRILAKTLYRELRSSGYEPKDVVRLVGELLSLVSKDVTDEKSQ